MRHFDLGPRRGLLLLIVACGLIAAGVLKLDPTDLNPGEGGLRLAKRFFAAALSPSMSASGPPSPESTHCSPSASLTGRPITSSSLRPVSS